MWNHIYWIAVVYFLAKQPSLIKLELIVLIFSSFKKKSLAGKKKKKSLYYLSNTSLFFFLLEYNVDGMFSQDSLYFCVLVLNVYELKRF